MSMYKDTDYDEEYPPLVPNLSAKFPTLHQHTPQPPSTASIAFDKGQQSTPRDGDKSSMGFPAMVEEVKNEIPFAMVSKIWNEDSELEFGRPNECNLPLYKMYVLDDEVVNQLSLGATSLDIVGLKFYGGSHSLMPKAFIKEVINLAHKHYMYASTGDWAEHVIRKGPSSFKMGPSIVCATGVLVLRDDFGEVFGVNWLRASMREAGSHGLFEIRCSDDIHVTQVIRPGEEAPTDSHETFKNDFPFSIQIHSAGETQSFALSMETKHDFKNDHVYFQFVVRYSDVYRADISRVITVRLPIVNSLSAYLGSIQEVAWKIQDCKSTSLEAYNNCRTEMCRPTVNPSQPPSPPIDEAHSTQRPPPEPPPKPPQTRMGSSTQSVMATPQKNSKNCSGTFRQTGGRHGNIKARVHRRFPRKLSPFKLSKITMMKTTWRCVSNIFVGSISGRDRFEGRSIDRLTPRSTTASIIGNASKPKSPPCRLANGVAATATDRRSDRCLVFCGGTKEGEVVLMLMKGGKTYTWEVTTAVDDGNLAAAPT